MGLMQDEGERGVRWGRQEGLLCVCLRPVFLPWI